MKMESAMKTAIRNSILLAGLLLAGCGTNSATETAGAAGSAGKTVAAVVSAAAIPDGAALYAADCSGCHGALTASAKTGADIPRIQSAITNNSGGMGFLATLTPAEIQAIATAIAPVPTGAALYQSNCFGCHGGLSTTAKAGANVTRILIAITANSGGMSFLSTLTPLQLQAIAATLAVATTGTALYAANCAGCHGVIAASVKSGAGFSRVQNAINSNTGGMGYLSTLTAADIESITAVLVAP